MENQFSSVEWLYIRHTAGPMLGSNRPTQIGFYALLFCLVSFIFLIGKEHEGGWAGKWERVLEE